MPDQNPFAHFLEEAETVSPLPASEIRRRGDRRRTVRRTAIAGGSGLATLAIAALVATSPWLRGGPEHTIAGTPSPVPSTPVPTNPASTSSAPTSSAPASSSATASNTSSEQSPTTNPSPSSDTVTTTSAPASSPTTADPTRSSAAPTRPTWANLPSSKLVFPNAPTPISVTQYEGIGQAAKGLCDPGELGSPTTVLTREYFGQDAGSVRTAQVLAYPSTNAASAAFDRIVTAATSCPKRYASSTDHHSPGVDVPALSPLRDPRAAQPVRRHYSSFSVGLTGTDEGRWSDTLVIQSGDRIMYLTMVVQGQDHSCSVRPDDAAPQCDLPAGTQDFLALLNA